MTERSHEGASGDSKGDDAATGSGNEESLADTETKLTSLQEALTDEGEADD